MASIKDDNLADLVSARLQQVFWEAVRVAADEVYDKAAKELRVKIAEVTQGLVLDFSNSDIDRALNITVRFPR